MASKSEGEIGLVAGVEHGSEVDECIELAVEVVFSVFLVFRVRVAVSIVEALWRRAAGVVAADEGKLGEAGGEDADFRDGDCAIHEPGAVTRESGRVCGEREKKRVGVRDAWRRDATGRLGDGDLRASRSHGQSRKMNPASRLSRNASPVEWTIGV